MWRPLACCCCVWIHLRHLNDSVPLTQWHWVSAQWGHLDIWNLAHSWNPPSWRALRDRSPLNQIRSPIRDSTIVDGFIWVSIEKPLSFGLIKTNSKVFSSQMMSINITYNYRKYKLVTSTSNSDELLAFLATDPCKHVSSYILLSGPYGCNGSSYITSVQVYVR